MSRAELLKCLGDKIVASGAGQTSDGRRRETCKGWPMIITIYIWSLSFVLKCFDPSLAIPLFMSKQHILILRGLSCTHRWRSKVILSPCTLLEVPFFLPAVDQETAPFSFKQSKCLHFFFGVFLAAFYKFYQGAFTGTRIPIMSFLHPPPQWFLWHTFCIVPPRKNNPLMQLKVLFRLQFLALPKAMRAYYEQAVVAKVLGFALLFVCIYNLPMWQSHLVSATGNLCLYLKYL